MLFKRLIQLVAFPIGAYAQVWGSWYQNTRDSDSRDFYFKIHVDPGVRYSDQGFTSACSYWAIQYYFDPDIGEAGYLGVQRTTGDKNVLSSCWGAKGVTQSTSSNSHFIGRQGYEFGDLYTTSGPYPWHVGHQNRMRMEKSRTEGQYSWWSFTIYDLTLGTSEHMGEIKTLSSKLSNYNQYFLEDFCSPWRCDTLRHAYGSSAAPRQRGAPRDVHGSIAGPDHIRGRNIRECTVQLPGMELLDRDANGWLEGETVHALDNNYRGIHKFGRYNSVANKGMMFAKDPSEKFPYIFRAVHDGTYGPLPAKGKDNNDWTSVGQGYPIINDLFFRKQRLYEFKERGEDYTKVGDFFVRRVCSEDELEFYIMLRKNAGAFPARRTSNSDWEYVGRHYKKTDKEYEDA